MLLPRPEVQQTLLSLLKIHHPETSLAVQWLGLSTFTARAWVQSLVGELRSRKPRDMAQNNNITLNLTQVNNSAEGGGPSTI